MKDMLSEAKVLLDQANDLRKQLRAVEEKIERLVPIPPQPMDGTVFTFEAQWGEDGPLNKCMALRVKDQWVVTMTVPYGDRIIGVESEIFDSWTDLFTWVWDATHFETARGATPFSYTMVFACKETLEHRLHSNAEAH